MLQNILPSASWELLLVWYPFVVCFASPTAHISIKKSYRTCVCGDIETELHLFFYRKFHDAARAILCNRVCSIATDESPELFDCLNNVELLCIFLVGLPDDEPSHISVAVFCAVDDFLQSCNRFWQYPRDLVHRLWEIHASLLYVLFMPIWCSYIYLMCLVRGLSFQMLYLLLLVSLWNVVLDSSNTVYLFLHFCLGFRVLPTLLYFESSMWHDKIAPVGLPPAA